MRKVFLILTAVLLSGFLFAQSVKVCPSCGWEVKAGDTVCGHCQAKLPRPKKIEAGPAVPVISPNQENQKKIIEIAEKTVCSNIASFRASFEKAPAVAYYYALNAAAVQRLLPTENLSRPTRQQIVNAQRSTFARLQRGKLPCRKCESTGKVRLSLAKADGTTAVGPMRTCPVCKGRGYRIGFAPVPIMKLNLEKGRTHFVQERIAAGDVRLGHAFIPADLLNLLNTRQKALVMTGARVACSSCSGIGREECTSCKGTGWTKCRNPGCKNGILQEKSKRKKVTRLNQSYRQECPVCEGTGEVACPKCKGRGSIPCRHCNGSGSAPLCKKCVGEGIVPCKKCKGTGKVKGLPCPDCRGECVIFCPACRGEGVIAK